MARRDLKNATDMSGGGLTDVSHDFGNDLVTAISGGVKIKF
jgi:hypothetical protein